MSRLNTKSWFRLNIGCCSVLAPFPFILPPSDFVHADFTSLWQSRDCHYILAGRFKLPLNPIMCQGTFNLNKISRKDEPRKESKLTSAAKACSHCEPIHGLVLFWNQFEENTVCEYRSVHQCLFCVLPAI